MMYYKNEKDGYVLCLYTGNNLPFTQITVEEYNTMLDIIRNKPSAPEGYDYRLKDTLEWELYELPPMPIEDEEATTEDYEAALSEVGI